MKIYMNNVEYALKVVKKMIKNPVILSFKEIKEGVYIACEGLQPLLFNINTKEIRGLNGNVKQDMKIIEKALKN